MPVELKDAAKAAIDADVNQYAITWGAQSFREAIAAMLAIVDPGDEVVISEPFYDNGGH